MKRTNQGGFTLIELLAVLTVGTLLLAWMASNFQLWGDSVANQAVADQQRQIREAAMEYIQDNAGAIAAAAGPTTPYTISVPTLIAGGYLPAGFTASNAYGLTTTIKVVEPTAGKLHGWVVSSTPAGTPKVSGQNLRKIANLIGADGGFAEAQGAGVTAQGAYGGWSASMDPIGGSPSNSVVATALFVADAAAPTGGDALMRTATAGQPELNRMSTAIDMANNDINGARTVVGTEVLAGAVSIGGTRYGASYPYETLSLPAGTNMRFNIGGVEQAMLRSDGYLQTRTGVQTSYVNTWDLNAAGGVNSEHHVNAKTTMGAVEFYASGWFRTTGDSGWYSQKWDGGWYMSDPTWVRSYNNKNVYTGGRIKAGEYFDIDGWAPRGGGCSEHGLLGQDGNGLLFCRGGTWIGAGGPTGGYYQYIGQFAGGISDYNYSGYNSIVVVQAMAYACGRNGYSVQLYVNGGWIGTMQENHPDYAKTGHTSFMVPAGGSFTIQPQWTGNCNTQFQVWQYYQT